MAEAAVVAEAASAVVTVLTVVIVVIVVTVVTAKEDLPVEPPEVAVAEVAPALRLLARLPLLSDYFLREHRSHSFESIMTRESQL